MNFDKDFDQDIKLIKKRAKWGCFAWAVIFLFAPIIIFICMFSYEMFLKEESIIISHSPNNSNTIEVVEKGQPASVQIFYGEKGSILERYKEYIPSDIYTPDNFMVFWKNDQQAKIEVIMENDRGETYIEDAIEIDLLK